MAVTCISAAMSSLTIVSSILTVILSVFVNTVTAVRTVFNRAYSAVYTLTYLMMSSCLCRYSCRAHNNCCHSQSRYNYFFHLHFLHIILYSFFSLSLIIRFRNANPFKKYKFFYSKLSSIFIIPSQ